MNGKSKTSKIAIMGVLCALAYVAVAVCRIPIVVFLKYEPKDVIIVIGGFMFGPLSAAAISVVVSLVEMVTISMDGFYGCVMNIVASCSFACVASFAYKRLHTRKGAYIGLIAGGAMMTLMMLLWNYIITPYYMGIPRSAVAEMLLPVFLPFNLFKSALNAALTLLLYKPVMAGLRGARLLPAADIGTNQSRTKMWSGETILAVGILAVTCALLILVLKGVI